MGAENDRDPPIRVSGFSFKGLPFFDVHFDVQNRRPAPSPSRVHALVDGINQAVTTGHLSFAIQRLNALAAEFEWRDRIAANALSGSYNSVIAKREIGEIPEPAYIELEAALFADVLSVAHELLEKASLTERSTHHLTTTSRFDRTPQWLGDSPGEASEASGPLVHCDAVGWRVGAAQVLRDITLDIHAGQIVGVTGRNAAGKTTLLRILAGRTQPTEGSCHYGKTLSGIAFVPQIQTSVEGTVELTLRRLAALHGFTADANDAMVESTIQRFELARFRDLEWHELSGGYKTRYALARAVLTQPDLLILDEPLGPLDGPALGAYLEHLRDLSESSAPVAVVISSLSIAALESIAHEIVYLEGKTIRYRGVPGEFLADDITSRFQISCDLPIGELRDTLSSLGIVRIHDVVQWYEVILTGTVTPRDVLELVLARTAKVELFRDVSRSVQRVFEAGYEE